MERTKRYISRQTVIILVVIGLFLGFAVGALAADQRLYSADAGLEKASVLIQAARDVTGELDEKTSKAYDKELAKAQSEIANARDLIANAIAIADGASSG